MPAGQLGPSAQALAVAGAAAVSHLLALLAFLALGCCLLGPWRRRDGATLLAVASLATGAWAGAIVARGWWGASWPAAAPLLESLRSAGWLLFLWRLLRQGDRRDAGFYAVLAVLALLPVAAALTGPSHAVLLTVNLCRLLLAVIGMLLVEQWYRHTAPAQRWGSKFAWLAVGALFAYDFFLYSDGLLLSRINLDIWAARGVIDALCVPLLALSMARSPAWARGLSVSRHVLLRSAALTASALYLLVMAAAAWCLRYLGGAWGAVMQLAGLGAALLLLAAVLVSGALRARLRIYINKHFYQSRFDYRQEWLRFTRALATGGPSLGERAIEALAQLVESPAGALWICRESGCCQPAANWNMAPQQASETVDGAFCQLLAAQQWVLDVQRDRAPDLLPPWLLAQPSWWLIVPLMLHGRLFGFVALTAPRAPLELNWEVTDLLKIAGSQAAGYLAHRESADSLAVARQFESFHRMATFVVHDLKNLIFQLSLLLRNAEKHRADPTFQRDMLATVEHSVKKMTVLMQKLSRGEGPDPAVPLQLDQLLSGLVVARAGAQPTPRLELHVIGITVLASWSRLERVLGHLIQNALEATAQGGSVVVRLMREQHSAVIELTDTGQGMSQQFIRERLFQPFESTKPAGMGIGVFESREYIREVGGELAVESTPGGGTTFRVILPLYRQAVRA